jgi:hypothetical protein
MHILGRNGQPTTTTAAALASFSAGSPRLVRGPLVSGSLLVSGPAALAGDLALLLAAHRRESSAFLARSLHGTLLDPYSTSGLGFSFPPQPAFLHTE